MPPTPRTTVVAVFAAAFAAVGASAQMTFENDGLTGETSVGGTAKTGDTESTDIGVGMKLQHETARWRNIVGGA